MLPYKAPLEDILFSLQSVAGAAALADVDIDALSEIGAHFAALAENELAPLNAVGDREGARLENGRVKMPDGFRAAYRAYAEQGWPGLTAPETYGGQGLGSMELALVSEIFSGANLAMQMITGLVPGAVRTLLKHGTEQQKTDILPHLASGAWTSTMALTEASAGSDLSCITCRATPHEGRWRISGEKIFISGGDQDLTEKIIHLVLARTTDGGLGGLSLFLCKSHLADGSRNMITITRIEEKMGLHASPTCQMHFDRADAELVGAEGDGLRVMFSMMDHGRLDVALQGVAQAARATAIARAYAAERVQGRGRTLDRHADIRRMLDEMDLRAFGARGIAHLALGALEREDGADLAALLTPVAKVFCTDTATEAADLGIQALGGCGYLREYGMEQIWRDARICRIYKGANGIHALALATRLMRLQAPLDALDALCARQESISTRLQTWRRARQCVEAMAEPEAVATAFMSLTGELVHGLVWEKFVARAEKHPDPKRIAILAERAGRRFAPCALTFQCEYKALPG